MPTNNKKLDQYASDIQRGLLSSLFAFLNNPKKLDAVASDVAFSVIQVDQWKAALDLWNEFGRPMLNEMHSRLCPTCNANASHVVFESYDGYLFSECDQCGTWYVPLHVDWNLFENFFERCPEARRIAEQSSIDRLKEPEKVDFPRFRKYLQPLKDLLPTSIHQKRYLDIGCNVGNSLIIARELGMLSCGVEADQDAVAIARSNNLDVRGRIADLKDKSFDLISMWETLEHIADPFTMLNEVKRSLAPAGLIAITVPNLNASGLRVAREKCSYVYGGFNSPGHINFFNRDAIEILFKRVGLALIDVSYEYSTSSSELFAYLSGIRSTDRPFSMVSPPQSVIEIFNIIWPAVTLIEDLAGTLPIMHCIACRVEDVSLFSEKCSERSSVRRHSLINAAKEQLNQITDPFKVIQDLQEEINKRDSMLESMQSNINRDRWWKRWRI